MLIPLENNLPKHKQYTCRLEGRQICIEVRSIQPCSMRWSLAADCCTICGRVSGRHYIRLCCHQQKPWIDAFTSCSTRLHDNMRASLQEAAHNNQERLTRNCCTPAEVRVGIRPLLLSHSEDIRSTNCVQVLPVSQSQWQYTPVQQSSFL